MTSGSSMDGQSRHSLSASDVAHASTLAKNHQQRLHNIPYQQNTYIDFDIQLAGHSAEVEIHISQIPCEGTKNSFYQPYARYYPCCDVVENTQVCSLIQTVYDVYLRPIRWRFDSDWYEKVCFHYEGYRKLMEIVVTDVLREIRVGVNAPMP